MVNIASTNTFRCAHRGGGGGGVLGGFKHPPLDPIFFFFFARLLYREVGHVRGPLPRVWETDPTRWKTKCRSPPPPPPPCSTTFLGLARMASWPASNCKTPPLRNFCVRHWIIVTLVSLYSTLAFPLDLGANPSLLLCILYSAPNTYCT